MLFSGPRPAGLRGGLLKPLAAVLACSCWATASWAGIYTCLDSKGRRLTADRPIPECTGKEQQVLNQDGSVRKVIPPTLTPEEKLAQEARERAAAEARASQKDAVRRDRNLVARYPNEDAHQRARESALDTVRLAIKASETRLRDLAQERKPLLSEAEFYVGKPLPPKLKLALDANDAALEAQKSAATTQEVELSRINRLYDHELERLRRLWAGAPAGSLGVIAPPAAGAPAATQTSAATAARTPTTPGATGALPLAQGAQPVATTPAPVKPAR
jgi:hypothetical protein